MKEEHEATERQIAMLKDSLNEARFRIKELEADGKRKKKNLHLFGLVFDYAENHLAEGNLDKYFLRNNPRYWATFEKAGICPEYVAELRAERKKARK